MLLPPLLLLMARVGWGTRWKWWWRRKWLLWAEKKHGLMAAMWIIVQSLLKDYYLASHPFRICVQGKINNKHNSRQGDRCLNRRPEKEGGLQDMKKHNNISKQRRRRRRQLMKGKTCWSRTLHSILGPIYKMKNWMMS